MIRLLLLVGFVLIALVVIAVGIGTYLVDYHNGQQESIQRPTFGPLARIGSGERLISG